MSNEKTTDPKIKVNPQRFRYFLKARANSEFCCTITRLCKITGISERGLRLAIRNREISIGYALRISKYLRAPLEDIFGPNEEFVMSMTNLITGDYS